MLRGQGYDPKLPHHLSKEIISPVSQGSYKGNNIPISEPNLLPNKIIIKKEGF